MAKRKPKTGRPRIDLDMELLAKLCSIQCTQAECANVLGVSQSTLQRRLDEETGDGFEPFFDLHSAEGKVSLRRAQFKAALGTPAVKATETTLAVQARQPNITMQIWLGKQYLDQKDKQDVVIADPEGNALRFTVGIPGVTSDG